MLQQLTKSNLTKLKSLVRRYPPTELYYKMREKLAAPYQDYNNNIQSYLPGVEERNRQCVEQKRFSYRPLVSIVVPTYNTPEEFLRRMIDSVISQTYPNWQLCIADGSPGDAVSRVVAEVYQEEPRIRYKKLEKNDGISGNTNQGFDMADGEYIALLDHDDLLVPSALYEMVQRINETKADFLYSDEDKVSYDLSQYMEPHFKLDFNGELLLGNNYICHFLMISRELLAKTGGLDSRYDGAQDFDFVLRLSEQAERIEHVAKILYHWRVHSGSTAGNTDSKLYAYEAGKRAVEECLKRRGFSGTVSMGNDLGFYRTSYQVPKGVTVGIFFWQEIINEKLRREIEQELITIGCRINWECKPEQAADYILILNSEIKKIAKGSIEKLLGSCARTGVGMVGSKSVFHGKVRQCGYWKKDGAYRPRFQQLPKHFKGYFRRACLAVEVDAVSSDMTILKGEFARILDKQRDWMEICENVKASGAKVIIEPQAEVAISSGK